MWLSPTLQAGNAKVGDVILTRKNGVLQYAPIEAISFSLQPVWRLVSAVGYGLNASDSTPFDLEDGTSALMPKMLGHTVLVQRASGVEWSEVIGLHYLGVELVAHISVGGHTYFAGDNGHDLVGSHNVEKV